MLEQQGHGRGDLLAGADGRAIPYDIRMGVWVTVEGETEYIRHCFEEYNAHTDPSGRYFTLYKRWHLIGLEVGVRWRSVALRGEPTGVATAGTPTSWPPPSATCKAGEVLDGEGGYTVWGKLSPAATSLALRRPAARPGARREGRAPGGPGTEPVLGRRGQTTPTRAYRLRREMEAMFAGSRRPQPSRPTRMNRSKTSSSSGEPEMATRRMAHLQLGLARAMSATTTTAPLPCHAWPGPARIMRSQVAAAMPR